jgi:hypothetical protein
MPGDSGSHLRFDDGKSAGGFLEPFNSNFGPIRTLLIEFIAPTAGD